VRWNDAVLARLVCPVSREDSVLLKTISGREQDLLDIKKLRELENES